MTTFTLGVVCGAVLIVAILVATKGSANNLKILNREASDAKSNELDTLKAKFLEIDDENVRLEAEIDELKDLLAQQKDHIRYLAQYNETLRQNRGRIPREDEG